MAIRKLSNSSIITGTKSSKFWDQETFPGYFESIATNILGSNQTTISFSSIPQIYTHLQVRVTARMNRADNADNITVIFNSDSGSNYSWHNMRGDGTSPGTENSGSNASLICINDITANSATSSIFGTATIDILDYRNGSKYKSLRALAGNDRSGSGGVNISSGSWRSYNAITTITFGALYGSGILAGSHFALYGIRSA